MVPRFLRDRNLTLHWYSDLLGGGVSPDYSEPMLLRALEQFVTALGARYDGDSRIAFITLGLLGFWGEFHSKSSACMMLRGVPQTACSCTSTFVYSISIRPYANCSKICSISAQLGARRIQAQSCGVVRGILFQNETFGSLSIRSCL